MSEKQQLSDEEKDQYFVSHREDGRGPWRGLGCALVIAVVMAIVGGGIIYVVLKAAKVI